MRASSTRWHVLYYRNDVKGENKARDREPPQAVRMNIIFEHSWEEFKGNSNFGLVNKIPA